MGLFVFNKDGFIILRHIITKSQHTQRVGITF